jgi:FKBP-type peptidyl-prolyl cis-trans isomerase
MKIKVWVVALASCMLAACGSDEKEQESEQPAKNATPPVVEVPDTTTEQPEVITDIDLTIEPSTDSVITTASGLQIELTAKGSGARVKDGDVVLVHYIGKLKDGTKFDASYDRGVPLPLMMGLGSVIKGWEEGLSYLSVGDKATLHIPSELGYGAQGNGAVILPNADLVFDVEVAKIVEPVKSESGLISYLTTETKNEKPQTGQTVSVEYMGMFTNGKLFDASFRTGKPYEFQLNQSGVIQGWHEGIGNLRKGESAYLVIPPSLGYGQQAYANTIPPNSTLIFSVELVDIK